MLDKAATKSDSPPLIEIDYVTITKGELASIAENLSGRMHKRLAFALLCAAKFYNAINPKNNNWVNCTDSEIMKMANVATSIDKQCALIYDLREAGLIGFSGKVDNLNIQVLFIDNESREAGKVRDFRNLGNRYHMFLHEPFFECIHCGLAIKRTGQAQKYCRSCASEMYVKSKVEYAMRQKTEPSVS